MDDVRRTEYEIVITTFVDSKGKRQKYGWCVNRIRYFNKPFVVSDVPVIENGWLVTSQHMHDKIDDAIRDAQETLECYLTGSGEVEKSALSFPNEEAE